MKITTCALSLLVVAIAAVASHAAVVTKTNATFGSFDGSSGYRSVAFALPDFGGDSTIVADVDISITFAKPKVSDFFVGDLPPGFDEIEFALVSPSGTTFTLISNVDGIELVPLDFFATFNQGSDGASFSGTIDFDQSASDPVDVDPDSITAGVYRPDDDTLNSLDVFNGETALGTWQLFIEDDFGPLGPFDPPSPLEFTSFSLTISTVSGSNDPIPEPSSWLIFGLGIGMLAGRRLMRRRHPTRARRVRITRTVFSRNSESGFSAMSQ